MIAPAIIPIERLGERDPAAVIMRCDVRGCHRQPKRAPRVIIPSLTPYELGHTPLRVMTTLHYCDPHHDEFDWRTWLTDAIKARVEATARDQRPREWKPDFDAVRIEYLLITTPEYRTFMESMGIRRVIFG